MHTPSRQAAAHVPQRFTIKVGDAACVVRATAVWPIPEVLELESQLEPGSDAAAEAPTRILERELIADVLASRMIVPPRPRRRGQRAVSSRAVFYAGVED
jgi:hypothetical protein